MGNFTFYYRPVKPHFTDPHAALAVCAGGIWVEGGALEACFDRAFAKYPPNFHRSGGALKKIEQICDEEPLWRNLRVFED